MLSLVWIGKAVSPDLNIKRLWRLPLCQSIAKQNGCCTSNGQDSVCVALPQFDSDPINSNRGIKKIWYFLWLLLLWVIKWDIWWFLHANIIKTIDSNDDYEVFMTWTQRKKTIKFNFVWKKWKVCNHEWRLWITIIDHVNQIIVYINGVLILLVISATHKCSDIMLIWCKQYIYLNLCVLELLGQCSYSINE